MRPQDSGPPFRPSLVCDADRIICPQCEGVARRITVGPGSSVAKCEERLKVGPRAGEKCGQHAYIAGSDEGFANVWPINREEYDYLTAAGGALPRPRDVLTSLRVLRRRDASAVPELPCQGPCGQRRKRYDLYEGICRWCRGDAEHVPAQALQSA